jgi:hypothetical protein
MINQSEILSCSHVQLITLFFGGAPLCCAFYQPGKLHKFGAEKTNFLSETAAF